MNQIPPPDQAARCTKIKQRSKLGQNISPEEILFCDQIRKKYPTWYKITEWAVFNQVSAAIGSNARRCIQCGKSTIGQELCEKHRE